MFLQRGSSTMVLLIETIEAVLDCTLILNPKHLRLLETMSVVDLGDVPIRGQYNRWYGQVVTFILFFHLCGTPLLFQNMFFMFDHTLLDAPRHAMWINAVKSQTYSTPGAAVLLALFQTVTNLKINPLAPITLGYSLCSRGNTVAKVR